MPYNRGRVRVIDYDDYSDYDEELTRQPVSMTLRVLTPEDKVRFQENKIAQIQDQIGKVERRMMEQSTVLDKLEHLHKAENKRTQRIMDRLGKKNYVINDEVERLYGRDMTRRYSGSPVDNAVVEDIIYHRNKEHSLAQQDTALRMRYLAIERQRLQDARERLRERRNNLRYAPTPVGSDAGELTPETLVVDTPSEHSAHSAGSYVRQAVDDLPYAIDRIYKLREDIQEEYEAKKRPYDGQLGLETYEQWQLDDYVIVRKLVENFVDNFLLHHIKPDTFMYERDMRQAMIDQESEEWERAAGALSERRAVTLAGEEIMLMVTSLLAREVAQDTIHLIGTFHNLTSQMLLNTIEKIITGREQGRDPRDPAYNLITRTYFSTQMTRNKHRKEIWSHTQHQHQLNRPDRDKKSRDQPIEEDVDADIEVITYDHLTPMTLRKYEQTRLDSPKTKIWKEHIQIYHKKEEEYWKDLSTSVKKLSLGKKCKGLQVSRVSPDQHFWAVGTVHGDVIVYDTWMVPWRPIKVVHNVDRVDDAVVDIAWSLDNSRLLTINRGGLLVVWSLDGGALQKSDMKDLDIHADSSGYIPQQLAQIAVLDVDQNDFVFQQGVFSEQGVLSSRQSPVKAAFFPSLTMLATQHSVCACLDNGDMLKCNLEPLSTASEDGEEAMFSEAPRIYNHNLYDENNGVNLIGQSLEAELFRAHKHPVMYIGFVDNVSNIVTTDVKGFINVWKYDSQHLSGYGWYQPQKKFRLSMAKNMYTPSSTEKPNVKFTDRTKSKKKTRQDIARERQKIENTLVNMQLGDPWHENIIAEQGLVASIYAPKGGVKDSGAMFHVVLRYKDTNQISSYLTRMYKPVKVNCTKILKVIQTGSGRHLVFMLLFPEYPPKDAHLSVLVLDLRTMKLHDFRQDINLTPAEFKELEQRDVASCDVSRVLGPTGSDYLYLTFSGRLRVFSLTSGNVVLQTFDVSRFTYFDGHIVDERLLPLPKSTEVTTVCSRGKMFAVLFSKTSTLIHILEVVDEHDHDTRRMMVKAFQTGYGQEMTPSEIRVDPVSYTPGDSHKEVEMRKIAMEAVEGALAWHGEGRTWSGNPPKRVMDTVYDELQKKIASEGVLEGRSTDEWRHRGEKSTH